LSNDKGNHFEEVDYTIQPIQKEAVWEGVLEASSMWAFADQGSFKMALRKTYKAYDKALEKAQEAKANIEESFNEEKLFAGFVNAILEENTNEIGEEVIEII